MSIDSMPLYINVERIYNELREAGYPDDQPLVPEVLFPFDQYHYHGTQAVENALQALNIGETSRVLEIGSGLGGPARYMTFRTSCHVTAIELQENIHRVAQRLTERCGLDGTISHVCADALHHPLPPRSFDSVVSWLAIHHIPDRDMLLSRAAAALKPGGRIFIEDFHERAPFAPADLPDVANTIFGVSLTKADIYVDELRRAGFKEVEFTDMTADWRNFCTERAAGWRSARDRHVRVHGEETYKRMDMFFSTVQRLFESESLGGLRLTAVI